MREWRALARYKLTQCVVDADYAHELSAAAKRTVRVHLKVDTGMHRLGEELEHDDEIAACYFLPHLRVTGMFTHLCVSDALD